MNIPDTIRTYLANHNGQFSGIRTPVTGSLLGNITAAELSASRVARADLVRAGRTLILVVVPANRQIDLDLLAKMIKRPVKVCEPHEAAEQFSNCDAEAIPPLGEAYGIRVLLDRALADMDEVYFATGVAGLLMQAEKGQFEQLVEPSWTRAITLPIQDADDPAKRCGEDVKQAIKQKIQSIRDLPAMSGIATQLLPLRNNPFTTATELAEIIEQDPSLSAQLIRYATSPLYGYGGKVDSVQTAVARVLGMELVFDLAMGLSLGKGFNNPKEGPLGLDAFWFHAVNCATLTHALCNHIDEKHRPPVGMGYLSGLLHNFGFLLLGHLFKEEFALLSRMIEKYPDRPLLELERETLGVTHLELGQWLMTAWDMPQEIIETVEHHHDPDYRSHFSIYANLVYIANTLLAGHGIGDGEGQVISNELLAQTHLKRAHLNSALVQTLAGKSGLDFIARKMAA